MLVSSYETGGRTDDGDHPEDQFSLNFVKNDFLYTVQTTGETIESFFDFSG